MADGERDVEEALLAFGASRARLRVLRCCLRHGPIGIADLAARSGMLVSSVRKHLVALERAGAVTAHRVRADGRRWAYRWEGDRNVVLRMIDDLDLHLAP